MCSRVTLASEDDDCSLRGELQESGPDIHLSIEGEVDGTTIRDLQQARALTLVQDSAKLDIAFDHREPGLTGLAIGTVLSVNA